MNKYLKRYRELTARTKPAPAKPAAVEKPKRTRKPKEAPDESIGAQAADAERLYRKALEKSNTEAELLANMKAATETIDSSALTDAELEALTAPEK